jgi:hypothetical protein
VRVGYRFDVICAPLILAGSDNTFVKSFKYLGICINAAEHFKCSFEHMKMKIKIFRAFYAIYAN